ncbi:MAG: histidine kinase [Labedaea sp.]
MRSRHQGAYHLERRRIQRDLHDGVQHELLVISMLVARPQAGGQSRRPTAADLAPVADHLPIPFLTNASSSTAAQAAIPLAAGAFSATVPARSLVTYRITH